MKLDRIDAQIIAALQNDARISNKELADQVGLAPSTCLERVRRLIEERVLRSRTRIDVEWRQVDGLLELIRDVDRGLLHLAGSADGFLRCRGNPVRTDESRPPVG